MSIGENCCLGVKLGAFVLKQVDHLFLCSSINVSSPMNKLTFEQNYKLKAHHHRSDYKIWIPGPKSIINRSVFLDLNTALTFSLSVWPLIKKHFPGLDNRDSPIWVLDWRYYTLFLEILQFVLFESKGNWPGFVKFGSHWNSLTHYWIH